MKKIISFILKSFGIILGLIFFYLLLVFVLPLIQIPEKQAVEPKNISIYIYTNGMHTDLVLPIKNEIMNWSEKISFENTKSKKTDYQYVGIGWGDKGFYLETPTWADLKISTALKAGFWLSQSAMHCTFYYQMTENEDCKKIMLTEKQYQNLIHFIQNTFEKDQNNHFILIKTDAVYDDNDAFYEAKGRYNFAQTCNTWANQGLKVAGQKSALWTATDKGIFRHYKK